MENTANYLQVLADSLDKKIVILKELERITKEQKTIAQADEFDDDAFDNSVERKGTLIDELEKLDNGFELLYNSVKTQLESSKDRYAGEIKNIQSKVAVILDMTASLQVMENSNKKLIESKFASVRKEIHQVKKSREMASNYYKTMNNINGESYFLDKKK